VKIIDLDKPKTGIVNKDASKGKSYWVVEWHYSKPTYVYKYSYDKKRYEVVR